MCAPVQWAACWARARPVAGEGERSEGPGWQLLPGGRRNPSSRPSPAPALRSSWPPRPRLWRESLQQRPRLKKKKKKKRCRGVNPRGEGCSREGTWAFQLLQLLEPAGAPLEMTTEPGGRPPSPPVQETAPETERCWPPQPWPEASLCSAPTEEGQGGGGRWQLHSSFCLVFV